ncbi:histidine kinase dimerization/phosphoacceptor domain -containing protein [Bacillus marasmi]|uniref:histidine kinase dimerization/phosphoacceptor domain -containing protein n=1 Tax=Bacillus marasmi TaxID=1926279 RepID=UPI00164D3D7C|nr:histidine kinase dimerization/phosphoacceptor domain -containing protein [Bacillus marasmi]
MSKYIFEINNLTYRSPDGNMENVSLNLGYGEIHAVIIKSSSEQNVFINSLKEKQEDHGQKGVFTFKDHILMNNNLRKNKILIMQQKPLLFNNFTVAENLNYANLPTRKFIPLINWWKVRKRAENILTLLDFQINQNTRVNKLTEENKRIVYIAGIFMSRPEVIIMQEPMEGLSANYAAKLSKVLKQFKEDGGSIIYVTKQWEEAIKVADRISILSKGKIRNEIPAEVAKRDPHKLLREIENYTFKEDHLEKDDDTQAVLEAIFKAAEFLTSEYELKDVLLLLAKEGNKVMNADGCSIKLIDEQTWSIIDEFGINEKNVKAHLTNEAIIKIAKGNDIFYVNENDKEFNLMFEKIENVKTFICIPVLIRNQVTGIIQLFYENLYVYSNEEAKYLSTLARHAAIAIEDTRLIGRSAFLQESHHRIKNNLQSIVGLIYLQKSFVQKNPEMSIDDALDSIISRVKSIASVHNLLARDKLGRSIINVKEIIEAVIDLLNMDPNIKISLDLDDILIPYNKATSIALIINELVINCFKHAFKGMDSGKIDIKCKRMEENIVLQVADNGIGLPDNFNSKQGESLGLTILQGIVSSDLGGTIHFINQEGTTVEVIVPTNQIFPQP